ncbi:MAG: hypothetical protein AB1635_18725 [Acidobacteriota bacterium]
MAHTFKDLDAMIQDMIDAARKGDGTEAQREKVVRFLEGLHQMTTAFCMSETNPEEHYIFRVLQAPKP